MLLCTLPPYSIFSFSSPQSTTYYVATYGNDSNPGTEASPWRTIQKAANTMGPGDTVLIRQGVYTEMVTPSHSGTEGSYITYSSYGSENVVIDAQNKTRESCIAVNGQKYLRFTGLTLIGAGSAAFLAMDNSEYLVLDGLTCQNSRFGIRLYGKVDPVSHITVRNSIASGNSKYGIFLYKRVYDSVIGPNNHVFSNGGEDQSYGIEIGTDYPGNQADGARRITVLGNEFNNNEVQGIRTWNAVNVLIQNNFCHHNGATGIQIEDGSENIIVEDNRCEYNAQTWEYETGIWIDSSKNVAVRRNNVRGNKIGLMVTFSSRVILRHNLITENNRGVPNVYNARGLNIKSNSMDVVAVHNTLYKNGAPESTKGGVSIYEQSPAVFKNNILADTTAPYDLWVDQDYTADYNAISNARSITVEWKGSRMTWDQYISASGQDVHSIHANPLFVAAETGDFRLSEASPCVNRGYFLTKTSASGSGRVVGVEDARYFTDGFGLAAGDLILVGRSAPATIMGVDYASNSITLDKDLSWNKGDGVSYAYTGTAPDIGAYGRLGLDSGIPDPPSGLKVVPKGLPAN